MPACRPARAPASTCPTRAPGTAPARPPAWRRPRTPAARAPWQTGRPRTRAPRRAPAPPRCRPAAGREGGGVTPCCDRLAMCCDVNPYHTSRCAQTRQGRVASSIRPVCINRCPLHIARSPDGSPSFTYLLSRHMHMHMRCTAAAHAHIHVQHGCCTARRARRSWQAPRARTSAFWTCSALRCSVA